MEKDLKVIRSLQLPNSLTVAGAGDYDKVWIRDNVYVALALVEAGHIDEGAQIYRELLSILRSYEHRLDIDHYPELHEIVRPRFTKEGAEVEAEWGNKQHDAMGILLFGIGELHARRPEYFTDEDKNTVQKIVRYLEQCRYWEDLDNGIWEEDFALHSSSLAACVKGLEAVSSFCSYDQGYLDQAKNNLEQLLPAESKNHSTDMALLTLVWPLGYDRRDLVENIENELLREHGVARYDGDVYEGGDGQEPEWVMGVPWLGVANYELGDKEKAQLYLRKTEELYTSDGLPESYNARNKACLHTPLAWSHAMALVLKAKLQNDSERIVTQ